MKEMQHECSEHFGSPQRLAPVASKAISVWFTANRQAHTNVGKEPSANAGFKNKNEEG